MSDQYIGEIRYFPYRRGAPSGWLPCDGSLQSIADYETLYALIGTTYGGDGSTRFGLPDLRGRVPIGAGGSTPLGAAVGTETVTLVGQQLPMHSHYLEASTIVATASDPTGTAYAAGLAGAGFYNVPGTATPVPMADGMIGVAGQGLAHENCAPTLPILACIAWTGVWPQNSN